MPTIVMDVLEPSHTLNLIGPEKFWQVRFQVISLQSLIKQTHTPTLQFTREIKMDTLIDPE